ncbi:TetR/AcrR family transcriptional regulator [Arthrobacter sp. HY1533]|uniref:TetR/AcrR family transcriptional regulator n=1 Tax=Arthrobacter sp. HY1533 TaxID=2970919 RepID=UPI0022B9E65F|nr:TetR/AcrR family transcriptional regulator [Arthrobacter sp. HY1533]
MKPATTPRTTPRSAASGRVRLDRETIIAAGLKLAASPGCSAISVRELGNLLDADPTAIYRHFRNKEHLMRELLDELIERSVASVKADPEDWRERLTQLAASTLDQFTQYPAIGVEAIVLTTHGPGELGAVEFMLDAFSRAGLSGDDLVRHYALMASQILSSAAGIARDRNGRGIRADESSPWFEGPILVDPRTYPHIAAVSEQLTTLEDAELFMLGVTTVIQSAERAAALTRQG